MARTIAILGLMALVVGVAASSYYEPYLLSDDGNPLLKDFFENEMLSVLGVIVTITLASAANLHLELNRLEEDTGEAFPEARSATKNYAYMLIILFGIAFALVVAKPLVADTWTHETLFNGAAMLIVALNGLALIDLTSAVFAIPAKRRLGK